MVIFLIPVPELVKKTLFRTKNNNLRIAGSQIAQKSILGIKNNISDK